MVLSKRHRTTWSSQGGFLDALHAPLVSFAFGRAVRELEAQLEEERVRREKLESQLDEYRAEISRLRDSLAKTRGPPVVSPTSAPPTRGTEAAARHSSVFVLTEIPRRGARKRWSKRGSF